MRARMIGGVVALLSALALGGCGTAALSSSIQVTVDDPAGALPPGPVRVAVFDPALGDTRDWATRSLGTASAESPYTGTVTSTETRVALDRGPAKRVRAGLFLPDYRGLGWYALELEPRDGVEQEVSAPLVAWDGYGPQTRGAPPLTVRVRSRADGDTWRLDVTPVLTAPKPDERRAAPTTASPSSERSRLTRDLIAAAARGDDAAVDQLLIKGAEINGADVAGRTAVTAAAANNRVETARLLVQRGADVNLVDDDGESAYLLATSEVGPDDALLVVMLNGGADITALDRFDGTGLIRAGERGFDRIVRRLLTSGVAVNHVNNLGWTALHEAIILGECTPSYVRTVEALVEAGADVDLPSRRDGVRPLTHAMRAGCQEVVDVLRGAGARP